MNKSYTRIFSWILLLAMAMTISLNIAGAPLFQKSDTTYLHLQKMLKGNKTGYLKNNFRITAPTLKTLNIPAKPAPADDKLLSDLQIYPNPVTDQINLKYSVSRNSSVTIKIMDVLGNEVITLFSRRVDPGEQTFKYTLGNKLNSGFYFLRMAVGPETVIRRISVL